MNKPLLLQIKEAILAEPRGFQMSRWVTHTREGVILRELGVNWAAPRCGTIGCIAGTACILSGDTEGSTIFTVAERATTLLGLTSLQAARLFFLGEWPRQLKEKFVRADTVEKRAAVAVERIKLFRASGGHE